MEHTDIRHKLSEYIDGSTTAQERTEIESHLKTCRDCTDALQELRKTIEQIKAIEEIEPPAWMTQKIMATVRAEAEEKKNIIQRLFYPLSVKLPLQTIAVVFLAIGAFYIYRNIQPVPAPSEAPVQEYAAGKQVAKDEPARNNDRSLRAKQVPQAEEYKALDMKQEYEKPAEPRLMDKDEAPPAALATAPAPAPAPAKTAEQPGIANQYAVAGKGAAVPQAGASAVMGEQATDSALHAEKKSKSAAPMGRALAKASAEAIDSVISVRVRNIDAAVRELEQVITRLGGSITRRENPVAKKVYIIKIDAQKLLDLRNELKLMGEVKDETAAPVPQDDRIEVRIELVQGSAQP